MKERFLYYAIGIFIITLSARAGYGSDQQFGIPRFEPIKRSQVSVFQLKSFNRSIDLAKRSDATPVFDLPVTYNHKVRHWIQYFQTRGRKWFLKWLSRSHRYLPYIQEILAKRGLPQDLAYLPMIESGYSPHAHSSASAVGYWQFIQTTANRFGLRTEYWIDERKDIVKSTRAAIDYLSYMHRLFDSWYLAAAGYNTGENRVKRLIRKYKTHDYWKLVQYGALPKETQNYVPKLIAAMLIAKAPRLYGFDDYSPKKPRDYEVVWVPGGTRLKLIAEHTGTQTAKIKDLNPDLIAGFVPKHIPRHQIKVPVGTKHRLTQLLWEQSEQKVAQNL